MVDDATSSAVPELAGTVISEAHPADYRLPGRDVVLKAARDVLAKEGISGLTVRRLAEKLGCSTKVIYTRFGGKDGLVHALYLGAFQRLSDAMAAVPRHDDPLARLGGGIAVYREVALADPVGYQVMFGGAIGDFSPPLASRKRAGEAFGAMRRTVADCMARGRLTPGDPNRAARLIWVTLHGAVSLELLGLLNETEPGRLYSDAAANLLAALGAPAEQIPL